MAINNKILYDRSLDLNKYRHSFFLFGPRATGKTSLLKKLKADAYFDLLDPELEFSYRTHPEKFWEVISNLTPNSKIIIDEVQRVPALLDYVQMGMEEFQHCFFLSGSSARKLKRGAANLLGGRALDLRIHPLTHEELGKDFSIQAAIQFGTLPLIYQKFSAGDKNTLRALLRSYITTYIKEEIQAEALVRKLDYFQRFLEIAAQSNAQMIEFANISRESGVAMSTVKEFYQIVEDTLLGFFLWPHNRSERKKSRPRFYFFDCGVVRAMQGRLNDPPTSSEKGFLFETWFVNEVRRLNDYHETDYKLSLWRHGDWEIDLLIERGRKILMGIEIKTGKNFKEEPSWEAFRRQFPHTPFFIASLDDERSRRTTSKFEVLPYQQALRKIFNL